VRGRRSGRGGQRSGQGGAPWQGKIHVKDGEQLKEATAGGVIIGEDDGGGTPVTRLH
jgi:hypothetical protein